MASSAQIRTNQIRADKVDDKISTSNYIIKHVQTLTLADSSQILRGQQPAVVNTLSFTVRCGVNYPNKTCKLEHGVMRDAQLFKFPPIRTHVTVVDVACFQYQVCTVSCTQSQVSRFNFMSPGARLKSEV